MPKAIVATITVELAAQERALYALARRGVEPCVIGGGAERARELCGRDVIGVLARGCIQNCRAGAPFPKAGCGRSDLALLRRGFDDVEAQVRRAESRGSTCIASRMPSCSKMSRCTAFVAVAVSATTGVWAERGKRSRNMR
ncbi:MAG: hypothetical protein QM702_12300 [Rubrivivax sp.]